ncbi:phosphate ABC transporter permease PstA [Oculatella sp. FACHB-28]|uniref:phosphate ABC transporter permease PstA n=1 Tax=Cyanophyceae TaxID=3028117 RepID=UPI001688DDF2|nr:MULTISPECIES: phosphate ABC transporter permease PstA [Cyanophyceae]MBD1870765.1 phosphate ABC transporter permease PstA [Cyanobacteria bacterium FACHB-471]MBD2056559.1 phosphate ABC transporter permease PstA [Oculatella sp. FACHB-28]MBD2071772.1 phosphate ABC transporter permease PstA [Leptolyngbya sp. FACHB-671]
MTVTDPNAFSQDDLAKQRFNPNLAGRYRLDNIFRIASWVATIAGLVVLAFLLIDVLVDGLPRLNWQFLTSFPSRSAERAGILAPLVGTVWLLFITALVAFPIGVGAGIFLEEFSTDNLFTRILEINIGNLAAVPSIIYGLLGLAVFVRVFVDITGGRTVFAAGLTLALLILPVIIVATREALRAVPDSLRLAGMALGATRWQTVREHVLPQAFPGILTGTILALSRAIGETAPLIVIGAQTFVPYIPSFREGGFSALPIQIFNWVGRPQAEFHTNAAAGIIVLMIVLLIMNATAIYLRNRFQAGKV